MPDEESEALMSPSKRKKKQADELSAADTASTADSSIWDDESEADTVATAVDDGLPHPRVSPSGTPPLLPQYTSVVSKRKTKTI